MNYLMAEGQLRTKACRQRWRFDIGDQPQKGTTNTLRRRGENGSIALIAREVDSLLLRVREQRYSAQAGELLV